MHLCLRKSPFFCFLFIACSCSTLAGLGLIAEDHRDLSHLYRRAGEGPGDFINRLQRQKSNSLVNPTVLADSTHVYEHPFQTAPVNLLASNSGRQWCSAFIQPGQAVRIQVILEQPIVFNSLYIANGPADPKMSAPVFRGAQEIELRTFNISKKKINALRKSGQLFESKPLPKAVVLKFRASNKGRRFSKLPDMAGNIIELRIVRSFSQSNAKSAVCLGDIRLSRAIDMPEYPASISYSNEDTRHLDRTLADLFALPKTRKYIQQALSNTVIRDESRISGGSGTLDQLETTVTALCASGTALRYSGLLFADGQAVVQYYLGKWAGPGDIRQVHWKYSGKRSDNDRQQKVNAKRFPLGVIRSIRSVQSFKQHLAPKVETEILPLASWLGGNKKGSIFSTEIKKDKQGLCAMAEKLLITLAKKKPD